MGIPQVPDQVKRAPTLVLRAVFSGIGRILLAADRPEANAVDPGAQPSSRWRSLDQTGNVRLLSAGELDGDYRASAVADEPTVLTPAADPVAEVLPLAHYDSLSLASLRARLRGLDVAQLQVLRDYELRNAERPDVLGMFERRIEKLESGA